MRKTLLLIALVTTAYVGITKFRHILPGANWVANAKSPADMALARAWDNGSSDVQVEGEGKVIKVLPDDNEGSRHQKFIVELQSGQTLMVAHNIDLAPRIASLGTGDVVAFSGEYEWSWEGGVIHWTHHDPGRRHVSGWLKHKGRFYQ